MHIETAVLMLLRAFWLHVNLPPYLLMQVPPGDTFIPHFLLRQPVLCSSTSHSEEALSHSSAANSVQMPCKMVPRWPDLVFISSSEDEDDKTNGSLGQRSEPRMPHEALMSE